MRFVSKGRVTLRPNKLEELAEDGEAESPLLCFLALGLDANKAVGPGKACHRLLSEVTQPDPRTDDPVTHSTQCHSVSEGRDSTSRTPALLAWFTLCLD